MSKSIGVRRQLCLLVFGLFVILSLVSPSALCSQPESGESKVAIGFDLGQSYGTSVARFENGTTVNLAQIRGSPQYVALMERLIQKPKTPSWLGHLGTIGHWLSIWRSLKSIAGLPATRESGILAEMVAALKSESERTLQTRIETAAVTAPWMAVWDNQIPGDSVVNDALVLAGLEPIDWMANEPIYLGETNAVLAANGRFICKELWCGDELEGNVSNEFAYLISFTNRSLHTSFQFADCFYYNSWDNELAYIDPNYGLDQVDQAATPADFWSSLRERLLYLVAEHTKRQKGYHSGLPFLVLVMGEAADTPEFMTVVGDVVKRIPEVRAQYTPTGTSQEGAEKSPGAELVASDDPTFAAAKGIAFWSRTRMDRSYCGYYGDSKETQRVLEETVTKDGHEDL